MQPFFLDLSLRIVSLMDDGTLVKECARGNAKAQRMLFDKFAPKMLAVCMRYLKNVDEAEDALQDGFVKVFQKIPDFKMEGSLEGWIRRIMVNNSLDAIRKNKKHLLEDDVDTVQHKVNFTDFQFENMDLQYLMKIIQSLPDGYRVVFNMFAIEGYSHKEIAETLGVSENTSKSQYSRARALLRDKLEQLKNVEQRSI